MIFPHLVSIGKPNTDELNKPKANLGSKRSKSSQSVVTNSEEEQNIDKRDNYIVTVKVGYSVVN